MHNQSGLSLQTKITAALLFLAAAGYWLNRTIGHGEYPVASALLVAVGAWLAIRRILALGFDALLREQQRLRDYAECTADWFWEMDAQMRFCHFSANFAQAYGRAPEDLLGKTRRELFVDYANSLPADIAAHEALLARHEAFREFEYCLRDREGALTWISVSGIPQHDARGQFTGYRGVGKNITARKAAEDAAEKADRLLREAIDQISLGFTIYDCDDRLVVSNQAYRTIINGDPDLLAPGASFEQLLRQAAKFGMFKPAGVDLEESIQRLLEQQRVANGEPLELALADGRWMLVSAKRTPSGYVVGNRVDISEQKQAQLRLEQLLAEQNVILNNEVVGIATIRDRVFMWTNRACEKMLGYGPGELNGMPVRHCFVSEEDYQAVGVEAYPLLAAGQVYRKQVRYVGKDGRHIWVDISGANLNLASRESLWAFVDISGLKHLEDQLRQHQMQLESLVQQRTKALLATEARAGQILDASADGLYGVDQDGCVTFINPAGCVMLGYAADQVIGRPVHALLHHSKADGSQYPDEDCPSLAALRLGQTVRVNDEVYWHADGHAVPVMYATHPIIQDGEIVGSVTSFVDVTLQRAAAAAREQALLAAEDLAHTKNAFLANMSHEIRTPLNGVLGFARIGIKHYQDGERVLDVLQKIVASGERLTSVVNNILDFSSIDSGKFALHPAAVNIVALAEHALDLVRAQAAAKHLQLQLNLGPALPSTWHGDPQRLGQVLNQLLSNALKFTHAGEVALSIAQEADKLLFTVSDSGIGMDSAQCAQLFNPFQQADSSSTRRFGGTGLGLAVSKRIIELMAGSITARSAPGVGTSIEFRLPAGSSRE